MKKNYSLAKAFDDIADELENSKLTSSSFGAVRSSITFANVKLQEKLSDGQMFILAVLLNKLGQPLTTSDFAEFAGVSSLRIISLESDLASLEQLGYIECLKKATNNDWEQTYSLSPGVIGAIRENRPYQKISYGVLSEREVLEGIHSYLKAADNSNMDYPILCDKIDDILRDCDHLDLFHYINQLFLSSAEKIILLTCITWLVIDDDATVAYYQYDDIIPKKQRERLNGMFEFKTTRLLTDNILLHVVDSDGDTDYALTENFKHKYFSDYVANKGSKKVLTKDSSNKIAEKKMFYNPNEEELITALTGLLKEDNFTRIQQRLADNGMRTGFTCLFYGSPGTGKTESVNQIARLTNREVIQVNLSTIRNCYVGESEKNVQEIFDDYKAKVKESSVCPILFFNEADAILCKRNTGAVAAVDKMENALQNILLQNLEDFDGILIATTNLTSSLDKAFERRFLYKIEFQRPNTKVRQQLWKSMIPELSDEDALCLAREFNFSGGEIENIARKQLIESILKNAPSTLESIRSICQNESILDTMKTLVNYRLN